MQCIVTCTRAYRMDQRLLSLFLFFKERLVSMRLDKEDNVQVAAINLCGHLLTLDMLEPEECIEMCELVFMDTKKTVSQAAGKVVCVYVDLYMMYGAIIIIHVHVCMYCYSVQYV